MRLRDLNLFLQLPSSLALWRRVSERHEPACRNLSGLNEVLGWNPDKLLAGSILVSISQTLGQDDALAAQEELRTIGIQRLIVSDDERVGASSDPVLILRVVDGANQKYIFGNLAPAILRPADLVLE